MFTLKSKVYLDIKLRKFNKGISYLLSFRKPNSYASFIFNSELC